MTTLFSVVSFRCPQEVVKAGDLDALTVALGTSSWSKKDKLAALFASAKYGKMDCYQMLVENGTSPNG